MVSTTGSKYLYDAHSVPNRILWHANHGEKIRAKRSCTCIVWDCLRTYKVFRYLCHAIELALEDDTLLHKAYQRPFYLAVAGRCGTSGLAIERSLRTLIDHISTQQAAIVLLFFCLTSA